MVVIVTIVAMVVIMIVVSDLGVQTGDFCISAGRCQAADFRFQGGCHSGFSMRKLEFEGLRCWLLMANGLSE